jgi:hypothetical protein
LPDFFTTIIWNSRPFSARHILLLSKEVNKGGASLLVLALYEILLKVNELNYAAATSFIFLNEANFVFIIRESFFYALKLWLRTIKLGFQTRVTFSKTKFI